MKKIIGAIVCVAVLAFIAVAQANQVRFLSRTSDGVAPSQDIHYTVMDLNGNKVAEDTVSAAEGEGVTISELEPGTYFVSAEQPSTGYFGSITTEVFAQDADGNNNGSVDLVLDRDGLQVYNPNAQNVAPARGVPTQNYGTPTYPADVPGSIPSYDAAGYGGGYGGGFGGGALGGMSIGSFALIGAAIACAIAIPLATASKHAE